MDSKAVPTVVTTGVANVDGGNKPTGGGGGGGSHPGSPVDNHSLGGKPGSAGTGTRSPGSGSISCSFPQTVKEAVAIAAGKKGGPGGGGSEDDDGKTLRSNMLCYLYWLLVMLILGLISFTVWLSIQLARRHNDAMMAQSELV